MSEKSNRKLFDNLVSRTKIYLVIIFILLVILSYLKTSMIIPSIILYLAILGYTYFANNKRRSEISEQLQDLTLTVDSAAKSSLINAPFPLLILETDGNIVWRSSKFITEFANIDINNYISDLIIDIKNEIEKNKEQKRKSIIRNIEIGKKYYKVQAEFAKTHFPSYGYDWDYNATHTEHNYYLRNNMYVENYYYKYILCYHLM